MITISKKKSKHPQSLYSLEINVHTKADHRVLLNSLDYAIEKKNRQQYLSNGGLILLNKFLRDAADDNENIVIELMAQKTKPSLQKKTKIKSEASHSRRK